MVKYSQNSQNSKFGMSIQYLKKELRDEADFVHSDKHFFEFPTSWFPSLGHQSLLRGDTVIIDWHDQAFSKYTKY